MKRDRLGRVIVGTLGLVATLAAAAGGIEWSGRKTRPRDADAIVVLGCRVDADGRASSALEARAREGARLWLDHRAPVVLLTGGVGRYAPSEAEAASRVVEAAGVPRDAILLESDSTSTLENASFARAIIPALRRVIVVSHSFHLPRAMRIFRRHFDEVSGSPVTGRVGMHGYGALREVPLLALELMRDLSD